jgi:hypothetical protein
MVTSSVECRVRSDVKRCPSIQGPTVRSAWRQRSVATNVRSHWHIANHQDVQRTAVENNRRINRPSVRRSPIDLSTAIGTSTAIGFATAIGLSAVGTGRPQVITAASQATKQ